MECGETAVVGEWINMTFFVTNVRDRRHAPGACAGCGICEVLGVDSDVGRSGVSWLKQWVTMEVGSRRGGMMEADERSGRGSPEATEMRVLEM